MEDDISNKVLTFTDDTEISRKITNDTDKQSLQDDLGKLVKWSEKWQMLFSFGKCKCIHIGHGNMDEEYKMGDVVLGKTRHKKGLIWKSGILLNSLEGAEWEVSSQVFSQRGT